MRSDAQHCTVNVFLFSKQWAQNIFFSIYVRFLRFKSIFQLFACKMMDITQNSRCKCSKWDWKRQFDSNRVSEPPTDLTDEIKKSNFTEMCWRHMYTNSLSIFFKFWGSNRNFTYLYECKWWTLYYPNNRKIYFKCSKKSLEAPILTVDVLQVPSRALKRICGAIVSVQSNFSRFYSRICDFSSTVVLSYFCIQQYHFFMIPNDASISILHSFLKGTTLIIFRFDEQCKTHFPFTQIYLAPPRYTEFAISLRRSSRTRIKFSWFELNELTYRDIRATIHVKFAGFHYTINNKKAEISCLEIWWISTKLYNMHL